MPPAPPAEAMELHDHEALLERYRNGYLKLRNVVHDRTTGLPSYPLLFDTLRTLLDRRRHVGVIHLDVADLSLVESLYGWQIFDRILARVAAVLTEELGRTLPGDSLLSVNGVGGERFVAFVPAAPDGSDVDLAYLQRIGATLRSRLELAFENDEGLAGLSPRLRFREGHAMLSENPFYRFERRVHAAVEEARTYPLRRQSRRERTWGAELKRIIRDSAVSTVFQPVVELGTRDVLGWEAFARGPKDSRFERPAAMFALSDRVGVSADLDRLCRRTALRDLARLSGRGKVFLNVLPGSLSDPDWRRGAVTELLGAAGLSPADLVLEVPERGADADPERFAEAMRQLQQEGFGLALDDVGTGYASLATLERVKPDYLKVDGSLVRGLHEHLIKQELMGSLVQLGRRIGAAVIAEGVESEQEARALLASGARYGQGYLFAGPTPLDSVAIPDRPGSPRH
jgi:EAL domain-containing protein (putative c-di-GMP-specific phosphodiesterase class I)/GGDEF domain-containing protein